MRCNTARGTGRHQGWWRSSQQAAPPQLQRGRQCQLQPAAPCPHWLHGLSNTTDMFDGNWAPSRRMPSESSAPCKGKPHSTYHIMQQTYVTSVGPHIPWPLRGVSGIADGAPPSDAGTSLDAPLCTNRGKGCRTVVERGLCPLPQDACQLNAASRSPPRLMPDTSTCSPSPVLGHWPRVPPATRRPLPSLQPYPTHSRTI